MVQDNSAKTVKIMHLKNLVLYSISKGSVMHLHYVRNFRISFRFQMGFQDFIQKISVEISRFQMRFRDSAHVQSA